MSGSPKRLPDAKVVGIAQVSFEEGFRIRLTSNVIEFAFKLKSEDKSDLIELILNRIETNLMLDLGMTTALANSDDE